MTSYIIRRLLFMILVLTLMTIVSFTVIQLPPGDFLTSYIVRLQQNGQLADQAAVAALRAQYGLDRPMSVQYLKWMWGLRHGNLGMSFERNQPVAVLIGERLPLTIEISVASLFF